MARRYQKVIAQSCMQPRARPNHQRVNSTYTHQHHKLLVTSDLTLHHSIRQSRELLGKYMSIYAHGSWSILLAVATRNPAQAGKTS